MLREPSTTKRALMGQVIELPVRRRRFPRATSLYLALMFVGLALAGVAIVACERAS